MQPDPNLINLIVGIVGILIGAIGIYIAIRTSREQWQIAERQGAFHKPRIGFAIFNCKLGQGYPDNERWYFIHPGKLEDFAAFPIEFNIYNAGDRITNEIFISIHVPNRIFWKSQLDGMESVTFPSLSDKDIQQSVDEIGNFTVISYALPPLSPTVACKLVIPFTFRPALKDFSVPLEVEGLETTIDFQMLETNIVSVTIISGDLAPSYYQFSIGAISASNLAEGIEKFVTLKQESPKKNIFVRASELFRYVAELKVTNFISFDVEKQATYRKRKIFVMKLPDKFYRGGWFNLPSSNFAEITDLGSGHIVGVIDLKLVPRSERKFRFKEGNLVEER